MSPNRASQFALLTLVTNQNHDRWTDSIGDAGRSESLRVVQFARSQPDRDRENHCIFARAGRLTVRLSEMCEVALAYAPRKQARHPPFGILC